MKHLFWLSILFISLLLSSCGSVEEEIVINKNNSGKYTLKFDMLQGMVEMTTQMTRAFSPTENLNEDSLREAVESQIWASFGGDLDSTLDLNQQLPDSIKNDPQTQKFIQNSRAFMQGSQKEGKIYTGIEYNFSSQSDLNRFFKFMNERNDPDQNQLSQFGKFKTSENLSTISIDGKIIKRTTEITQEADMDEKAEKTMEELFEDSYYRTTVIVPGKIKSAKGDGLVSIKGNKAVFEHKFVDFMNGSAKTDFEIELK
jgi:hypothetical protein